MRKESYFPTPFNYAGKENYKGKKVKKKVPFAFSENKIKSLSLSHLSQAFSCNSCHKVWPNLDLPVAQ